MHEIDLLIKESVERFGYESEEHFIQNLLLWIIEDRPEGTFSQLLNKFIQINIKTKNGTPSISIFSRR